MIYFDYEHQSSIIDIFNAVEKLRNTFNDKHISSDVKVCDYLGKR